MKEEVARQMSREFPQTSDLTEQTQRMNMMEAKIDKLMQNGKIWLHSSEHAVSGF